MTKKDKTFYNNQLKLLKKAYPKLSNKDLEKISSLRDDFWKCIIVDHNNFIMV